MARQTISHPEYRERATPLPGRTDAEQNAVCPGPANLWSLPIERRGVFRLGFGGLLGAVLGHWIDPALAAATARDPKSARSCILLWMNGGPSHIDLWDPKPGAATGGPFRAIKTRVPGVEVCEHLPRLAEQADKLAIQEEVQDWLLKRVLPQPSAFEVVWNPSARWMVLGTTSLKMLDAFLELFENHFRTYPVPLYHARWALHTAPIEPQLRDALSTMVNVESVHAVDEGRFLGYEFLTWLWFFTEHAEGKLRYTPELDVQVELGERLVLTLPGEGREKVVCTTQANALSEARVALQQGKMVEEIQIQMRAGDNDYQVTLDSTLHAFKGLKTPRQLPDFDQEDPDGRFLEKMFFIEEVSSILNALYATYLRMRLGGSWESDTLPVLKEWIGEGPAPV